jgi:riboflavin kinase/FMN adenylyltransferase
MRLIQNLTTARLPEPTVLTIGTFDGIHRGHQALLTQLVQAARQRQAQAVVLTFHPRPKTVLAPHLANNDYLTTSDERMALLEKLGLDALMVTPFTREFAQTPARDFMQMVVERINLVEFWAGHDFALGKNREGNLVKLTELGREFGYTVRGIEPLVLDGQVVSSTRIRDLLRAGDARQAAQLLGRYPSLSGVIVTGQQRGRRLGFPTTNLAAPPERLIPANGVYATFAYVSGQSYASVTNIGLRPSFEDAAQRTIETHILDFNQDIYGQPLTLEFVERLRPEKKFASVNDLTAQIAADAAQARALLAGEVAPASINARLKPSR